MWPVFVSLVVLCWTGVAQSSLGCPSWNQFHLGRMNSKIIHLLDNMVRQRERPNSHACTRTTDTLLIKSIFLINSLSLSLCLSVSLPPVSCSQGGYLPVYCKEKQTVHFFPENIFTDAEVNPVHQATPLSSPLLFSHTYLLFFVYRRTQSHCLSCKRGSCSSRFLGAI